MMLKHLDIQRQRRRWKRRGKEHEEENDEKEGERREEEGKYQPKITSSTLITWETKNDPFSISSTIFKIPKPKAQKFQTEVCALFYFIQSV